MKKLSMLARRLAGKKLLLAVAGCVMGVAQAASAATVNFDNLADGAAIGASYSGLTFVNPLDGSAVYARSTMFAASPGNVVSVFQTGFPLFDGRYGAVEVVFAAPQQSVSIDAAPVAPFEFLVPLTKLPYLQVLDINGNFLQQVNYSGTLPDGVAEVGAYETLTISRAAADIYRMRFSVQTPSGVATYGLFDNLSYSDGSNPTVVPVPAAVWGGMILLGGLGMTKLRRRKDSVADVA